jgi:hypothetical protein
MMMKLFLLAMVVWLFATGCFGNAAMVSAMKDNTATFCAKIVTPWGGATYLQSNPTFGNASCDGMQVSYGNPNAGTVNVPVTVTPQVTIGAPQVK